MRSAFFHFHRQCSYTLSGMMRKGVRSTGEHRVLAQLVLLPGTVTSTATLSCGSVNCISRNKLGKITRAGMAWDPIALA